LLILTAPITQPIIVLILSENESKNQKKREFLSMNNDLMTIIYLEPAGKSLDILFFFFFCLSLFIIYLLSDILVFSFSSFNESVLFDVMWEKWYQRALINSIKTKLRICNKRMSSSWYFFIHKRHFFLHQIRLFIVYHSEYFKDKNLTVGNSCPFIKFSFRYMKKSCFQA